MLWVCVLGGGPGGGPDPRADSSPGKVVLNQYLVFASNSVVISEGFDGVSRRDRFKRRENKMSQ